MKKQFFAAAMILALGAGFTACSSDDLNVKDQKEAKSGKTATTYLTYSFSVATPGGTRAATNDGQGDDNATAQPGYNFVERWKGSDKITNVTAYIFDAQGALEKRVSTPVTELTFDQNLSVSGTPTGKTTIRPTKGINVTVGQKTVFLVVNETNDVKNFLAQGTDLYNFKTLYESADLTFAGRTATASASTTDHSTAADQLVTFNTDNTATFVMTGAPVEQNVIAGVDDPTTVGVAHGSNASNRFNFTVKRAVATVFVTSKQDATHEYTVLKGDNPLTADVESEAALATVSELTFSQAQGELNLYLQQKAGATTSNTAYQTPAYDFVTNTTNYDGAITKYDYVGLWNSTPVTQLAKDKLEVGDGEDFVKTSTVVPFLPATHQWTAEGSNYKEGNTAYVLVRVKLKPIYVYKVENDQLVAKAFNAATDNAKFFYGSDKKFYADLDAVNKAAETNTTMTAKMFVNGRGLYFVWINPDTTTGKQWKNSPTNRNNIYHISIKDIKSMPDNWNPLVPGVPSNPGNPNDPRIVPNPDPKPSPTDNPKEPDPKHKPENPLSPVETWMSVDATILPWSIHSYGVEL